jgi:hypothetical protein
MVEEEKNEIIIFPSSLILFLFGFQYLFKSTSYRIFSFFLCYLYSIKLIQFKPESYGSSNLEVKDPKGM